VKLVEKNSVAMPLRDEKKEIDVVCKFYHKERSKSIRKRNG